MVLLEPRRRPVAAAGGGERGGGPQNPSNRNGNDDDDNNNNNNGDCGGGAHSSPASPIKKSRSDLSDLSAPGSPSYYRLPPPPAMPLVAADANNGAYGWKSDATTTAVAEGNASRLCADRRRRRIKGGGGVGGSISSSNGRGGGRDTPIVMMTMKKWVLRHWRRITRNRQHAAAAAASAGMGLAALAALVVILRQFQLASITYGGNHYHHHGPASRYAKEEATSAFRLVFRGPSTTGRFFGRPRDERRKGSAAAEGSKIHVAHPHRDFFGPAGPDYGGLHFDSMRFWTSHWFRVPYADEARWYDDERGRYLEHIDVDTDPKHDHWEEITGIDRSHTCHRMEWVDSQRQTCNLFHELHLGREPISGQHHHHKNRRLGDPWEGVDVTQPYHRRYLSHGYYRDSWLWESAHFRTSPSAKGGGAPGSAASSSTPPSPLGMENFVLKALRLNNPDLDYGWWTAHHMFKEALVMERTTASPRTMNIYGHCYTSLLVEQGFEISQRIVEGVEYHGRGRIKQDELDKIQANGTLASFNEFSAEEKLEIALAMAEAIAVMHGHDEGVIVNDDVHPDQFLVNKQGQVKFNDMNNAHILDWNPANSSYCKWPIWIGGDYRSPEEMRGEPIDEKSDVWPMGALIFGLLTGLFPYYTEWDARTIEKIIASGEPPYLDPRWRSKSYIEGRMVEIMEKCFADQPEDRVSIFEVVLHLRVTAGFADVLRQQGKVDWSTKPAGLVPEVSIPSPEYESYGAHNDDGDDDGEGDDHDDHPSETSSQEAKNEPGGGGGAGGGGDALGAEAAAGDPPNSKAAGGNVPVQDDKRRSDGVRGARDGESRKTAHSDDDHLGEEQ